MVHRSASGKSSVSSTARFLSVGRVTRRGSRPLEARARARSLVLRRSAAFLPASPPLHLREIPVGFGWKAGIDFIRIFIRHALGVSFSPPPLGAWRINREVKSLKLKFQVRLRSNSHPSAVLRGSSTLENVKFFRCSFLRRGSFPDHHFAR